MKISNKMLNPEVNPLQPSVAYLYPLKASENLKVLFNWLNKTTVALSKYMAWHERKHLTSYFEPRRDVIKNTNKLREINLGGELSAKARKILQFIQENAAI